MIFWSFVLSAAKRRKIHGMLCDKTQAVGTAIALYCLSAVLKRRNTHRGIQAGSPNSMIKQAPSAVFLTSSFPS